MHGLVLATMQCAKVGTYHVVDKYMIVYLIGGAANNGAPPLGQRADEVAERMMQMSRLQTGWLTIHLGIAQNGVLEPVVLRIVAHVPFARGLADSAGSERGKRRLLHDRKSRSLYLPIQPVTVRSEDKFINAGAHAALQNMKQSANMEVSYG